MQFSSWYLGTPGTTVTRPDWPASSPADGLSAGSAPGAAGRAEAGGSAELAALAGSAGLASAGLPDLAAIDAGSAPEGGPAFPAVSRPRAASALGAASASGVALAFPGIALAWIVGSAAGFGSSAVSRRERAGRSNQPSTPGRCDGGGAASDLTGAAGRCAGGGAASDLPGAA